MSDLRVDTAGYQKVRIYTGTNIKGLKAASGMYGYVLETEIRGILKTLSDFGKMQNVTKNQAELIAVTEALSRMKRPCEITIFTESSYVAAGPEWIEQWKEKDWTTSKGKPVSNKEEWMRAAELMKEHEIKVECKKHEYSSWIQTELGRRDKEGGIAGG